MTRCEYCFDPIDHSPECWEYQNPLDYADELDITAVPGRPIDKAQQLDKETRAI